VKRIRYLPSADADLLDIFFTIALDHEPSARAFRDKIRTAILRLADFPLSAPARTHVAPDMRGLTIGNYTAFYRVTEDEVRIVRILHHARDTSGTSFD